jgi:hypothetical protein
MTNKEMRRKKNHKKNTMITTTTKPLPMSPQSSPREKQNQEESTNEQKDHKYT